MIENMDKGIKRMVRYVMLLFGIPEKWVMLIQCSYIIGSQNILNIFDKKINIDNFIIIVVQISTLPGIVLPSIVPKKQNPYFWIYRLIRNEGSSLPIFKICL